LKFNLCRVQVGVSDDKSNGSVTIQFIEKVIPDMPHTILTFLQLISSGLYNVTTVQPIVEGKSSIYREAISAIIFGQPISNKKNKWTELYRERKFGFPFPTKVQEVSPFAPCTKYSVGLFPAGRGPFFVLYLRDSINDEAMVVNSHTHSRHDSYKMSKKDSTRSFLTNNYCFGRLALDNTGFIERWLTKLLNNARSKPGSYQTVTGTHIMRSSDSNLILAENATLPASSNDG
jgi:hypothetical protein